MELDYPYNLENQLISLFKLFDVRIKKQIFKNSINSIIELKGFHANDFIKKISNFPSCKIKKY